MDSLSNDKDKDARYFDNLSGMTISAIRSYRCFLTQPCVQQNQTTGQKRRWQNLLPNDNDGSLDLSCSDLSDLDIFGSWPMGEDYHSESLLAKLWEGIENMEYLATLEGLTPFLPGFVGLQGVLPSCVLTEVFSFCETGDVRDLFDGMKEKKYFPLSTVFQNLSQTEPYRSCLVTFLRVLGGGNHVRCLARISKLRPGVIRGLFSPMAKEEIKYIIDLPKKRVGMIDSSVDEPFKGFIEKYYDITSDQVATANKAQGQKTSANVLYEQALGYMNSGRHYIDFDKIEAAGIVSCFWDSSFKRTRLKSAIEGVVRGDQQKTPALDRACQQIIDKMPQYTLMNGKERDYEKLLTLHESLRIIKDVLNGVRTKQEETVAVFRELDLQQQKEEAERLAQEEERKQRDNFLSTVSTMTIVEIADYTIELAKQKREERLRKDEEEKQEKIRKQREEEKEKKRKAKQAREAFKKK